MRRRIVAFLGYGRERLALRRPVEVTAHTGHFEPCPLGHFLPLLPTDARMGYLQAKALWLSSDFWSRSNTPLYKGSRGRMCLRWLGDYDHGFERMSFVPQTDFGHCEFLRDLR
jgi:hypothetical protein